VLLLVVVAAAVAVDVSAVVADVSGVVSVEAVVVSVVVTSVDVEESGMTESVFAVSESKAAKIGAKIAAVPVGDESAPGTKRLMRLETLLPATAGVSVLVSSVVSATAPSVAEDESVAVVSRFVVLV
jgi:hypothetical protein